MSQLIADVTPTDRARVARLVLAWIRGDQDSMDFLLVEADNEPAGLAALVFALTDYSANLTVVFAGDQAEAQLEAAILHQLNLSVRSDDTQKSDDDSDDESETS